AQQGTPEAAVDPTAGESRGQGHRRRAGGRCLSGPQPRSSADSCCLPIWLHAVYFQSRQGPTRAKTRPDRRIPIMRLSRWAATGLWLSSLLAAVSLLTGCRQTAEEDFDVGGPRGAAAGAAQPVAYGNAVIKGRVTLKGGRPSA